MKKLFFSLALAAVAVAGSAQNSALYKAQDLEAKGDMKGALSLIEEALQNPKTTKIAEMYNYAAELYAKMFNPELLKAAQSLPFDTLCFANSLDNSVQYYLKSHEADVKPDAKGKVKSKFVKANHDRVMGMLDFYNYAAVFMNAMGDEKKSLEFFAKYLELPKAPVFSPHETDSIYASKKVAYAQTAKNIAILNYQAKNFPEALKYADMALKDNDDTHDLYIIKMQSCAELGDSAAWLHTLTEAALHDGGTGFMQNLLYYYVNKGDLNEAVRVADDLVARSPENKSAWYMKGCVDLNMARKYAEARESFEKALSMDPNFLEANVNMANAYINEVVARKQNGEFKYVGTGKTITKSQMPAYQKELNEVKDYYRKALPYMEKARELSPDHSSTWAYSLQMIYSNLEMKDKLAEIEAVIAHK